MYVIFLHLVEDVEGGNVGVDLDNVLVVGEEVDDVHDGRGHPSSALVVELFKGFRHRYNSIRFNMSSIFKLLSNG